jgi:hypothetical protein
MARTSSTAVVGRSPANRGAMPTVVASAGMPSSACCSSVFSWRAPVRPNFAQGEELPAPSNRRLWESDLRITEVVPTLPADRAGLESGDLLIAVEGTPVTTVAQAKQTLGQVAARRAGPCNDTASTALDPSGRTIARSTPIPPSTLGPGVPISIRRGTEELLLPVDLRWTTFPPTQPTATPVPPAQPYL